MKKTLIVCSLFILMISFLSLAFAENAQYDALQQLFLEIDETLTMDNLEKQLENSSLFYSKKEYSHMNGGEQWVYKIAFDKEVASQYRPESGDYIAVRFWSKINFAITDIEYHNSAAFQNDYHQIHTAIF